MIDFSGLKKYIFFPRAFDRDRDPYVIHVLELWGDSWKGNRDAEELLGGRFSFYPLKRCQPYSDELWAACEAWRRRRLELAEDFDKLMRKGVKDGLS